jgi:hypothetical protein
MDPRLSCHGHGLLHLSVPDEPGDWSALLYLWSPNADLRRAWQWPRNGEGRLLAEFRCPEPWKPGYYKVLVHVMWDLREGLLGAYLRTT